jgi:hypothetical protein
MSCSYSFPYRSGAAFAQASALKLYRGLVRPFRWLGKLYELRCGQLSRCTIVVLASRR